MLCELGNDASGQFFTPYDVCRCMVEISGEATRRQRMPDSFRFQTGLRCGRTADCFCQPVQEKNICYHDKVLFVAQDIDLIAGLMCYIQLSF